jgi:hypothetical protein
MMGDKVKRVRRRELIPPYLSREERFAFRSALPLDVCVRRLLARNDGIFNRRTQVSVENVGMNDQEFVIRLRVGNTAAWAFGTLSDIDGETTWVAGKLGASEDMEIVLWVLTAIVSAFFLLMLISGPYLLCMVFSVLVAMSFVSSIRHATQPMHKLMREVFGGKGPLPLQAVPQEMEMGR